MDATEESNRLGRLINHYKKPNCRVQVVASKAGPFPAVFAVRDVGVGDEITFDYGIPISFEVSNKTLFW